MGEKEGHTVDKYERQGEKLRDRERGGIRLFASLF